MEKRNAPSASQAEDSEDSLLPAYTQQQDYTPPAYSEKTHSQPLDYQPVAMDNKFMEATSPGYDPMTQPRTVIIQQPTTIIVSPQEKIPSAVGAITFSCFVLWCCCFPFGLIAFIYGVWSERSSTAVKAARHIRVSKAWSWAGLISGIMLALTFIWLRWIGSGSQTCLLPDYDYWAVNETTVGASTATIDSN